MQPYQIILQQEELADLINKVIPSHKKLYKEIHGAGRR
jgi:hypothetical protein